MSNSIESIVSGEIPSQSLTFIAMNNSLIAIKTAFKEILTKVATSDLQLDAKINLLITKNDNLEEKLNLLITKNDNLKATVEEYRLYNLKLQSKLDSIFK